MNATTYLDSEFNDLIKLCREGEEVFIDEDDDVINNNPDILENIKESMDKLPKKEAITLSVQILCDNKKHDLIEYNENNSGIINVTLWECFFIKNGSNNNFANSLLLEEYFKQLEHKLKIVNEFIELRKKSYDDYKDYNYNRPLKKSRIS